MELPDSVKAFGAQIDGGGEITPPPEFFEAYDVFAAELAQIFTRPWLAVDHASRLAADRARFRLARYAMQIQRGLILVDPSAVAPEPPPAGPVELGAVPLDLADRAVSRRQQYKTTWNWKRLRQFLWASPGLALGRTGCDEVVELGPLSLVALGDGDAALLRIIPRF